MAEDTTIRDAIATSAAEGIRSASGDNTSVTKHSIQDLIAADRHISAKTAVGTNPNRGLRFNRIVPARADW